VQATGQQHSGSAAPARAIRITKERAIMANTVTVIGVYEFYLQAQGAMDELLASGCGPSELQLKPHDETPASREIALHPESESRAASHGLGHFFRLLFGIEEKSEHTDLYSEAVRRGSYVLTVKADSDEHAERAADIMNQHDPVDIDERSVRWRSEGWVRYDNGAPIFSEHEVARERSASLNSNRGSRQEGPAGGIKRGRVRLFKQAVQPPVREATPSAASTASETTHTNAADEQKGGHGTATKGDNDFRSHWQSAYGPSGERYEEYAPAYHFGYSQASKERYRGHRWSDSEIEVRRDWEAAHPGSGWDKVRDAVRFGWERIDY
jgi:hypothetical protein